MADRNEIDRNANESYDKGFASENKAHDTDEGIGRDIFRGPVHEARYPGLGGIHPNASNAHEERGAIHAVLNGSGTHFSDHDVATHVDAWRKLASHPDGREYLNGKTGDLDKYEKIVKQMVPRPGYVGHSPSKDAPKGLRHEMLKDLARPIIHKVNEQLHLHGLSHRMGATGVTIHDGTKKPEPAPEPAPESSEAKIDLHHEDPDSAESGIKIHPFNTIQRLKSSYPGITQKQRRKMLADIHGISMANAGRYDRQYHAVPEADDAEHGHEEPHKLAARGDYDASRKAAQEYCAKMAGKGAGYGPWHGLVPSSHPQPIGEQHHEGVGTTGHVPEHEQIAAMEPTHVPTVGSTHGQPAHDPHDPPITIHDEHAPNPLHSAVRSVRGPARTPGLPGQRAGGQIKISLAAVTPTVIKPKDEESDPPKPESIRKQPPGPTVRTPATNVSSKVAGTVGSGGSGFVESSKVAKDRPLPFTPTHVKQFGGVPVSRPDTFHQGMLQHIHKQFKTKNPALAQAARDAMMNKEGAHAKVGKLLPEGHVLKDHDWANEEKNQHLDNWVEHHAHKLINTNDERTAALSPDRFWHFMHRQFGTGGGTNKQHDEFWNRMNREFRGPGANSDHYAVKHFKGLSPQRIKEAMQASLERIRNKHVDQAHFAKKD